MIELEVRWLPFRIIAFVVWPFVIYYKGKKTECNRKHEEYHWRQIWRWGIFPWYFAYLMFWITNAPNASIYHRLERNAYKVQWECERLRDETSRKTTMLNNSI